MLVNIAANTPSAVDASKLVRIACLEIFDDSLLGTDVDAERGSSICMVEGDELSTINNLV
jgi:hypothetical protein